MTATRAEQAQLRLEGRADAIVLLAAHRKFPRLDVDELGDCVGVDRFELQRAVARFKALAEARRPKQPPVRRLAVVDGGRKRTEHRARKYEQAADGTWPCPIDGCTQVYADGRGLGAHVRTHETVDCECGRTINLAGLGPHRRSCPGPGGET